MCNNIIYDEFEYICLETGEVIGDRIVDFLNNTLICQRPACEFKALSLSKLMSLAKELKKKYPDRSDRIDYIVDVLATKLQNLRVFTLTDYLFTLYLASREFKEFEELMPEEETVEKLLLGEEE